MTIRSRESMELAGIYGDDQALEHTEMVGLGWAVRADLQSPAPVNNVVAHRRAQPWLVDAILDTAAKVFKYNEGYPLLHSLLYRRKRDRQNYVSVAITANVRRYLNMLRSEVIAKYGTSSSYLRQIYEFMA